MMQFFFTLFITEDKRNGTEDEEHAIHAWSIIHMTIANDLGIF